MNAAKIIEEAAAAAYWQRVNPDRGAVTLSVAVRDWNDLPDQHRSGIQVWHCKQFWRDAARAAILATLDAIREPSEEMLEAGSPFLTLRGTWRAIIDNLRREVAG